MHARTLFRPVALPCIALTLSCAAATAAHAFTSVTVEQTSSPAARTGHVTIYDPVGDRVIMFGGRDNSNQYFTVWQLSLNPLQWTQISTTGAPPLSAFLGAAAYDPLRNRMIYTGGFTSFGLDVYFLDLATGVWSNPEPYLYFDSYFSRYGHSAIYDPVRDRIIIFGGHGVFPDNSIFSDAYELSLGAGPMEVRRIGLAGTQPGARYGHAAVYDPQFDRMIVTFGWPETGSLPRNDVFFLRFGTTPASWAKAWLYSAYVRRGWHSAVYDPDFNRTILYGGTDNDAGGSPFAGELNTGRVSILWNLSWEESSLGGGLYTPLNYTTPTARKGHAATIARSPAWTEDKMIVIGGSNIYSSGFPDATSPNQTVLASNYGLELSDYIPGESWETLPSGTEPQSILKRGVDELVAGSKDEPTFVRSLDLSPNTPNPFRDGTRITFDLPSDDFGVRLDVFDVGGRIVATLAEGMFPAGRHAVGWSGRDETGQRVRPGVYTYRLRTTQGTLSRKMVVW